jgi:hypothetical protein
MERNDRWFNRGVAAYRLAKPNGQAGYACPICLRVFRAGGLSVEHVPPKAAGGRPLVLTCVECNRTAGHEIDHHLVNSRRVRRFARDDEPLRDIRAQVEIPAGTVNARLTFDGDRISVHVAQEQNHPATQRAVIEYLNGLVVTGDPLSGQFHIYPPHVDSEAEKRAWLRVGYLIAFAAFGYRYILDPVLDVVRAQILEKRIDHVGMCVSPPEDGGEATTRLLFVQQPEEISGLAVQVEGHTIMLPRAGDYDYYESADRFIQDRGLRIDFTALECPWPEEPVLALDFAPPGRVLPQLLASAVR